MQQWRVNDVMTAPVITTPERTPVRELVGVMSTHRVSAVPIVDDDNRVVGLVSQADLLPAQAGPAVERPGRLLVALLAVVVFVGVIAWLGTEVLG